MLQFSKRLEHKGLKKVTLVVTKFVRKTYHLSDASIAVETISDGYDDGGIDSAESVGAYLDRFRRTGPETLAQLLQDLSGSGRGPVGCIVYDAFLPWGLDVARRFGIRAAAFFTQSCAVGQVYDHVFKGLLGVPVSAVELPGLVRLGLSDLPSFVPDPDSYPPVFRLVVDQFSNVEEADFVLCNSFFELEEEVVNRMTKTLPLKTVGPTIPSMFLDKRIECDNQYGLTLSSPNNEVCTSWLNSRPKRSVVYVSFGSLAEVEAEQLKEVACGLRKSNCPFLWVVRSSEKDKLPKGFLEESLEKGNLVISWCNQLEVLANDKIGCFVTHCGWNSTLEALAFGVPMVAMPQWSDQFTNAKYIADVWKVGVKAERDHENGIVRQQVLEKCLNEIMDGERGHEMRNNAIKWSELAKKAMNEGGSSDTNIDEFIANLDLSQGDSTN